MPPLPFPAEEIRNEAMDRFNDLQLLIGRLILFYRGHQKDTSILTDTQIKLLSMSIRINKLDWPSTNTEPPFPTIPPTPADAASPTTSSAPNEPPPTLPANNP